MSHQQATYRLRGHHLLCLLGYRGMGYSPEYVQNMTQLHRRLREQPETLVTLVVGPDDLCAKFPETQPCHCHDATIMQRDSAVRQRLGVEAGETYRWSDIEQRIQNHIVASDIATLCRTCSWRSYGVCEAGVERLHNGEGLFEVPNPVNETTHLRPK
ncbi:DUF1284 domain-containing protein [Alicyclobacillus suci]|uniref:DUF1284 domain-containing protein n=1 Tax=Alicyclobacillus suci TaxID=2816080 RepID=UPI003F69F56E